MDIEELIEQLKDLEACAYGYHINGEVLGMDCSDFEQVMADAVEEISKIHTLRAENEQLKDQLYDGEGVNLVNYWIQQAKIEENGHRNCQAENEQLRVELEQVKRALAMMWFAYMNSDKESPHSYETEALEEAERLLGPWEECMPKYLRRGPKED